MNKKNRLIFFGFIHGIGAIAAFTTSALSFGQGLADKGAFWAAATVMWVVTYMFRLIEGTRNGVHAKNNS